MPILYWFLVVTFFVTYWVDKFTVLRIYRKPPRYGKTLMKTTREWLNLALFLHFGFAFWMLSNSTIFETDGEDLFGFGTDNEESQTRSKYNWIKLDNRINQYHTFIYAICFGIFILCFFFKTILFNAIILPISKSCKKNKNKNNDSKTTHVVHKEPAYSNNYFKSLELDHLQSIIIKTDKEKKAYEDMLKYDVKRPEYHGTEESIKWYIDRLENMQKEQKEILDEKVKETIAGEKGSLYVQDHTYDIKEIFPYCNFIADEDLLERDKEGKNNFRLQLIIWFYRNQRC